MKFSKTSILATILLSAVQSPTAGANNVLRKLTPLAGEGNDGDNAKEEQPDPKQISTNFCPDNSKAVFVKFDNLDCAAAGGDICCGNLVIADPDKPDPDLTSDSICDNQCVTDPVTEDKSCFELGPPEANVKCDESTPYGAGDISCQTPTSYKSIITLPGLCDFDSKSINNLCALICSFRLTKFN